MSNTQAVTGLLALCLIGPGLASAQLLADFEGTESDWSVLAPATVRTELRLEPGPVGQVLRLDYEMPKAQDFAIIQTPVELALPENFAFRFKVRADRPLTALEFKLIDGGKHNVSWAKFPVTVTSDSDGWQQITLKRRHFSHAWGPAGNTSTPLRISAIEIGIPGATSVQGSLWLDDLVFEPIATEVFDQATITAASAAPGHAPDTLFDHDAATGWRSADAAAQWLAIDLGEAKAVDGIEITWDEADYARAYELRVSNTGTEWRTVHTAKAGQGGREVIFFPPERARYLRLEFLRGQRDASYAIKALEIRPAESALSFQQRLQLRAAGLPRGSYPRYLLGEQTYWTVVGVDGDNAEAMINEEGMVEVDREQFSLEPFVYADGALIDWGTAEITQTLAEGDLPIPSVEWRHRWLTLTTTLFADGVPGAARAFVRYRVGNTGPETKALRLFVAARPFQVNPPWQSLNTRGGMTLIPEMRYDGERLEVGREKFVIPLTPPSGFGAAPSLNGREFGDFLRAGELPEHTEARDMNCYVSGAFAYDLEIPPGESRDVYLVVPFQAAGAPVREQLTPEFAAERLTENLAYWRERLGRVTIEAPAVAEPYFRALRSTLAYILINRDGPAIQPGSRAYARSWIRDGALTSAALLAFGFTDEVKAFIEWYAQFQQDDGSIPCCVDGRGADLTEEHDSHGQFIYLIAEYFRHTGDRALVESLWPRIQATLRHIETLRALRMTDAYRQLDQLAYFGMLPESISHEGYAAQPVHAFWDAYFTLRGLKDAAYLVRQRDDFSEMPRLDALRQDFTDDLHNSIVWTIDKHLIDYVPASVELGDMDPSAIAAAIAPLGELRRLPQRELKRTFERYDQIVQDRLQPDANWHGYAPYEFRIVEALVLMGERARAQQLLAFLFDGRRPPAWNAWAEVVHRDARAPYFVGDIPHTWIGSDFIRALRSMLAYEREDDQALVLFAGLPFEWLEGDTGLRVAGLPTWFGKLDYQIRGSVAGRLEIDLTGDLKIPPGGIELQPPLPGALQRVTVNGVEITANADRPLRLDRIPAQLVYEFDPAPTPKP
ncbi:MAG: discoidin domain-containing protein [Thiotrichales bacterium]